MEEFALFLARLFDIVVKVIIGDNNEQIKIYSINNIFGAYGVPVRMQDRSWNG